MKMQERYSKIIARRILENTLAAGPAIFSAIAEFGEVTIDIFLNPSYYGGLPRGGGEMFLEYSRKKEIKEITIRQNIRRLQKHGFVEKKENKYFLTVAGKKLASYIFKRKKLLAKRWDKKYRVVIFDVPEKKSRERSWLRNELHTLKYRQLQESVFIGRFPLAEDLIREIKSKKMSNFVNYLLVDRVYDIGAVKDDNKNA